MDTVLWYGTIVRPCHRSICQRSNPMPREPDQASAPTTYYAVHSNSLYTILSRESCDQQIQAYEHRNLPVDQVSGRILSSIPSQFLERKIRVQRARAANERWYCRSGVRVLSIRTALMLSTLISSKPSGFELCSLTRYFRPDFWTVGMYAVSTDTAPY